MDRRNFTVRQHSEHQRYLSSLQHQQEAGDVQVEAALRTLRQQFSKQLPRQQMHLTTRTSLKTEQEAGAGAASQQGAAECAQAVSGTTALDPISFDLE